jgi:hypothetical protein
VRPEGALVPGYSGRVAARSRTRGPALALFLWSRAAIWALAAAAVLLFEDRLNPERGAWDTARLHDAGAALDVLARWDSNWFLQIAEEGYRWPSASPAFFPLYPLLTGALGRALAGHYVVAGVIVSLAAGAVAFELLYRLSLPRVGADAAFRTVLFLAVAPMSLFLGVAYSESLFLALAVGCFLAAERGRLGWAAVLAGLALLTRPQGVALLPALGVFAWRARPVWTHTLGLLVVPLGMFLAYPLTLWLWVGEPLAFLDAEDQWGRHLSWLGPLGGVLHAAQDGDAVELTFAAVMSALGVAAWRRLGPAYGLYALGALALAAAAPSDRLGGLYSFPRLSLVAFPCFMALGGLVRDRRLTVGVACASAALLGVYVLRWALWYWVS